MIVANLATYPPRRSNLMPVVEALAPQVDRLNVVLNEYDAVPEELSTVANVNGVIPDHDTKDAGKFYPDVSDADYVLMVDDDVVYPDSYVADTVARFEALGPGRFLAGYHGSVYVRPAPSLWPGKLIEWLTYKPVRIADYRKIYIFYHALDRAVLCDQIATNAAIMRGADFPPYDVMRDSQKFVDVRLTRWCHDQGIRRVALPRDENWITPVRFDETIHGGFTRTNPQHVADEIWQYAFKTDGAGAPWKAAA